MGQCYSTKYNDGRYEDGCYRQGEHCWDNTCHNGTLCVCLGRSVKLLFYIAALCLGGISLALRRLRLYLPAPRRMMIESIPTLMALPVVADILLSLLVFILSTYVEQKVKACLC
jgi:hypothetical protein